jgi:hypothetical protein
MNGGGNSLRPYPTPARPQSPPGTQLARPRSASTSPGLLGSFIGWMHLPLSFRMIPPESWKSCAAGWLFS